MSFGEVLIIEALKQKLIPDTIAKDNMPCELINKFCNDPVVHLIDKCIEYRKNENFANSYCNICSEFINALREVDMSKLRIS